MPKRVLDSLDIRLILVALIAVSASGCSSFNSAWRKSVAQPVPTDSISGPWRGRWSSDANGHNGKLLCIVTAWPDGNHSARFQATYKRLLKFSYTVALDSTATNGVWRFHGQEDLGKLAGGIYQYDGQATPAHFQSTYRSKYDHGVFDLSRPGN